MDGSEHQKALLPQSTIKINLRENQAERLAKRICTLYDILRGCHGKENQTLSIKMSGFEGENSPFDQATLDIFLYNLALYKSIEWKDKKVMLETLLGSGRGSTFYLGKVVLFRVLNRVIGVYPTSQNFYLTCFFNPLLYCCQLPDRITEFCAVQPSENDYLDDLDMKNSAAIDFLFDIYDNLRWSARARNIQKITLDYTWNDQLFLEYLARQRRNLDLRQILDFLAFLPPTRLNCSQLSVNEVKAIYVICHQNRYFREAKIDFRQMSVLNNGLGYFLRE